MKSFLISALFFVVLAEVVLGKDEQHLNTTSSISKEPGIKLRKRSLTVFNGLPLPDILTNAETVDTSGPGMHIRNGKVGAQANIAMESSRKKRNIIEHIGYVNKQVNISKRNVTDDGQPPKETGNGKSKRWTENINHLNKQINVDMGNR